MYARCMLKLTLADLGEVEVFELRPQTKQEGEGVAIVLGSLESMAKVAGGPLVRVHSCCLFGDTLGSMECDCGAQLNASKSKLAIEGQGIIFYLIGHEGRGAGLQTKMRGYQLQQAAGVDTFEAYTRLKVPFDQREYGHCARFLNRHGIDSVRLLSNNPKKESSLVEAGIHVLRIQLLVGVKDTNKEYMKTKRDKAGHIIPHDL
jgi:3,4-dihydroxy 2-butanone 4-phosphate synthase / GTP cyclohydrolase II